MILEESAAPGEISVNQLAATATEAFSTDNGGENGVMQPSNNDHANNNNGNDGPSPIDKSLEFLGCIKATCEEGNSSGILPMLVVGKCNLFSKSIKYYLEALSRETGATLQDFESRIVQLTNLLKVHMEVVREDHEVASAKKEYAY